MYWLFLSRQGLDAKATWVLDNPIASSIAQEKINSDYTRGLMSTKHCGQIQYPIIVLWVLTLIYVPLIYCLGISNRIHFWKPGGS